MKCGVGAFCLPDGFLVPEPSPIHFHVIALTATNDQNGQSKDKVVFGFPPDTHVLCLLPPQIHSYTEIVRVRLYGHVIDEVLIHARTYIGSTPSPPRRIRQHNGEISQGAWKTKYNRPWVMQMIVYGFPSKLAALQFEWAWQHPHLSRHLRDKDGKSLFGGDRRSKYIKMNIQVARAMITCHPYNIWPLHVKLFTDEAVKIWNDLSTSGTLLPLPPGLSHQIELEGVDGKSGKLGSGRTGPIDISDDVFTSAHLTKHETLLASGRRFTCSICHKPMDTYPTEPLTSALCTTADCTATSHLSCLAHKFLQFQLGEAPLVPRGGHCDACDSYTLWGDIVKGCYRRSAGKADPVMDDDDDEGDSGEVFGSDEEQQDDVSPAPKTKATKTSRKPASATVSSDDTLAALTQARSLKSKGKQAAKPASKGKAPRKIKHAVLDHASVSSDVENFDLNAISPDDEPDNAPRVPDTSRMASKAGTEASQALLVAGPSRMASPIRNSGRSAEPHNVSGNDMPFAAACIEDDVDLPGRPTLFQSSEAGKSDTACKEKGNAVTSKDRRDRPRKKYRLKGSQRPNFNIFPDLREDDASPYDDPSKPEAARFQLSPGEFSEDVVLPDVPRISENKRGRLVLENGEVDFFDEASEALQDRGSPRWGPALHNSSPRTKHMDQKGSPMGLTSTLSTLSVSSPASSTAPSPVRGNRTVMNDDVDIIILSD